MAIDLESKVMREVGLGQHYSWFNGSGSCDYCRNNAISKLPEVANANGLTIRPEWLQHLEQAKRADNINSGRYGLTNTWVQMSYAIQDAIYRSEGGGGFSPGNMSDFRFYNEEKRQRFLDPGGERMMRRMMMQS